MAAYILRSSIKPSSSVLSKFINSNISINYLTSQLCHYSPQYSRVSLDDQNLITKQALTVLSQKQQILDSISSSDYSHKLHDFFDSSVGGHIRHSMDHFRLLLDGKENINQFVNYDERKRNTDVERDIAAAKTALKKIIKRVEALGSQVDVDANDITVSFIGETQGYQTYSIKSHYLRELSFASHHAIHHLSMIKVMMKTMGYEFSEKDAIGIAFSTVKDLKQKKKL